MKVTYVRERHVKQRLRQEIAGLADELGLPRPHLDKALTFGELMKVTSALHARRGAE